MSRIAACSEGNLLRMQMLLLDAVRELIKELTDSRELALETLVAVGNPTMVHIFLGISPEGIGQYPFTPAFVTTQYRSGEALGLPVGTVIVPPSASAFIGSDAVMGAISLDLDQAKDPVLLLDIGTNGEVFLFADDRILATSCAAGPALEGAGISSGMGGVAGAVASVIDENGVIVYTTVKDGKARGICGAGLVDWLACLLDDGTLEYDGYLESDVCLIGCHKTKNGTLLPAETAVTLTASDVRKVQLAKSAIRAGVETLFSVGRVDKSKLTAFCLAGGLGYYISPKSACRIGLFDSDLLPLLTSCGTTALKGAVMALCDPAAIGRAEALCRVCETVDLNAEPEFSDAFIEYMLFPE
ncbi:MAG: DUF4445 domain-containing protein [Clostridia bacterium]|nr:DUF4445 domain-containing protein [Clostridia bacterium]